MKILAIKMAYMARGVLSIFEKLNRFQFLYSMSFEVLISAPVAESLVFSVGNNNNVNNSNSQPIQHIQEVEPLYKFLGGLLYFLSFQQTTEEKVP